jgi:hypothetical protein
MAKMNKKRQLSIDKENPIQVKRKRKAWAGPEDIAPEILVPGNPLDSLYWTRVFIMFLQGWTSSMWRRRKMIFKTLDLLR